MTGRQNPSSIRVRVAAALSPEVVALVLTIVVLLGVLLIVRPTLPAATGGPDRSGSPSVAPPSSGMGRSVAVVTKPSGPFELRGLEPH